MEPSHPKRRPSDDHHHRRPSRPRRTSSSDAEDLRPVADGEVEEFFAILRRLHDARSRRDSDYHAATRWSPAFVWEDFAAPTAAADAVESPAAEERVAESENAPARVFDLNADPVESVADCLSPRGENTARRCAPGL